jgi:hemin uptake protein HemP
MEQTKYLEGRKSALEPVAPAEVSSGELLRDRRELIIRHGAERYRLLLTKGNKLILMK